MRYAGRRKEGELRAQTHRFLDEVGEKGLDQLTKSQPPGFGGAGFGTAGGAILIIAGHACGHLGQLNAV
jgi:hypothetical protein